MRETSKMERLKKPLGGGGRDDTFHEFGISPQYCCEF